MQIGAYEYYDALYNSLVMGEKPKSVDEAVKIINELEKNNPADVIAKYKLENLPLIFSSKTMLNKYIYSGGGK
jgi:hypothetical protein